MPLLTMAPELITLGALTDDEVDVVLGAGSEVAVWSEDFRALLADRARAIGRPARVHVKHDSGMGRLGTFDGDEVLALARACAADPYLELAGVWTHFATADEPDDDEGYFFEQLDRFEPVAAAVRAEFPERHRPRRQQRRRLPLGRAPTSTWPAAGWRSTGSTRSRTTRARAASPRSSRCAPTSPR